MTIYWCFNLTQLISKIKYFDYIKDVNTIGEFNSQLSNYRNELKNLRPNKNLPI